MADEGFPYILKAFVPAPVPTKVFQGRKALSGSSFETTEQMEEFDSSLFWLLHSLGGRTDRLSNLWAASSHKSATATEEGNGGVRKVHF